MSCSAQRATTGAKANWASIAAVPRQAAAPTSPHRVWAIPRPRARLWAASRVDATLMPADESAMNTPYTARISWYSPIPSLPRYPAMYTRKAIPSSRRANPPAVSSTAFFRYSLNRMAAPPLSPANLCGGLGGYAALRLRFGQHPAQGVRRGGPRQCAGNAAVACSELDTVLPEIARTDDQA